MTLNLLKLLALVNYPIETFAKIIFFTLDGVQAKLKAFNIKDKVHANLYYCIKCFVKVDIVIFHLRIKHFPFGAIGDYPK